MEYVVARHKAILDFAGGSGGAASEFVKHGVDALFIDNNKYTRTRPDMFPWTQEMDSQGRLIVGDVDRIAAFAAGRTLGMFFLEPGALYPAAAVKAYAKAGGRRLLLKLGNFIGGGLATRDPNYMPPQNPNKNILRFLHELIDGGWREVPDPNRPPWRAFMLGNNLWDLERIDLPVVPTFSAGASEPLLPASPPIRRKRFQKPELPGRRGKRR